MSYYDDFERGFLVGLLVGEGSFTMDHGRPVITIGMTIRHRVMLERLAELVPGARLYGPYQHASRLNPKAEVMLWRVRGGAAVTLLEEIGPNLLDACPHVASRVRPLLAIPV